MSKQIYTYNNCEPVSGTKGSNTQNSLDVTLHGGGEGNSAYDSFGRLRVSNTDQRLDVEFLYDKQPEYFDSQENNGTVTHNASTRDLTFALDDANNGSYAIMSSYPVPYTPGNSQKIDMTGVLNLSNIAGGTVEYFLRTSVSGSTVTTTYPQAEWNNHTSEIDFSKSHIFSIDFQSLKVGNINFFISKEGVPQHLGTIINDNVRDSGYWAIPNLPVYYKIYTDGGNTYMELGYGNDDQAIGFRYVITANATATMKAICCTVKSEGGGPIKKMPGLSRGIDMGSSSKTVSTTLIPLISLRARDTFNSLDNLILSVPRKFSLQTDDSIRLVILHDTVLTNAVWTNVDTEDSCIEYDRSATALSGGHINTSVYIYAQSSGPQSSQFASTGEGLLGKTFLWNRKDDTLTGIITIAAIRTGGSDADVLASIDWEEIR